MAGHPEYRSTSGSPGALARRTRELKQEDSLLSSSLPLPHVQSDAGLSALTTVHEHADPLSTGSAALETPRRPRAGTMPSSLNLRSSPPTSASAGLRSTFGAPDSLRLPPARGNGPVSLPNSGQTTPLEQPFASALLPPTSSGNAPSSSSQSRLRSGSLTLPSGNLSNAFGGGVFSSEAWERTPNERVGGTAEAVRRNLRMSGPRPPERENSYNDDSHVRTLDYLGLADESSSGMNGVRGPGERLLPANGEISGGSSGGLSAPAAPLMQRLGSAGSIQSSPSSLGDYTAQHSRLRSNTVGTFSRTSPVADSLLRPFISPAYAAPPTATSPLHRTSQPGDSLYSSAAAPNAGGGPLAPSGAPTAGPFPAQHRPSASIDSARLLYATTGSSSAPPTSPVHSGLAGEQYQAAPVGGAPVVTLVPPTSASPSDPSPPPPALDSNTPAGLLNGQPSQQQQQRGRSATVATVDDPAKAEMHHRRRAGTTVGIPPHQLGIGAVPSGSGGAIHGGAGSGSGPVQAMASRMSRLGVSDDPAQSGSAGWAGAGGAAEGVVSLSPPPQQPTRSLWVGNLDPKTSPAELQDVFAPYGAIESLRLIPEKECGFVNFVSVADAMRAKEDVLNRLGGQLTKTSGLVRIGYGKAESTPSPNAPGLVHPRSGAGQAGPGDLSLQTQPTRALWIGSIPPSTTPNHLLAVFSAFGPIESARVLTHKSCGFVNFERLDDAVSARKALNGREILGNQVGPVRIGFAKVPTKVATAPFGAQANPNGNHTSGPNGIGSYPHVYDALSHISGVSGVPVEKQLADGQVQDYRSNMLVGLVADGHYASAHMFANGSGSAPIETTAGSLNEMQLLMRELSQGEGELEEHVAAVAADRPPVMYYTSIPLAVLNDQRFARRYSQHDAPRLREIRKRLEGDIGDSEADAIANDLMDEVVPLASDYIGNTLVQKLFELCSVPVRKAMLERIAPHLAPIGTHKNGTWAVQKIIQCAEDEDEFALIQESLAPYTPPLLLNDFGNYVVQGALRFAPPHSDFIFDAMVDRIWEIGAGRFGARSTRQTLESPDAPRVQVKRVASAIILNAIPLATSSNGALLVTWLLESSGLPNRFSLVAPRFAPHLSHLCTHKLAAQSIMRVINQDEDDKAQQIMIDAFVDRETKVLEDVLSDQMHGIACIHKVVSSDFLPQERRRALFDRVKEAVETLKVGAVPVYRRLIEDVGGVYSGPRGGLTPPFAPSGLPRPQSGPRLSEQGSSAPAQPPPPGRRPHNRRPPPSENHHQQQQFVPPQLSYPPPSPYVHPMQYGPPPPHPYGSAAGYPLYPHPMYGVQPGQPMLSFSPTLSPSYGPGSPHSSRDQGPASPAGSPMVAHATMPYSPAAYPSIASPDPFQALRVSVGDGPAGFNPAFSPLASPPPPFFSTPSFGTFAAQQEASHSAADRPY